MNAFHGWNDVSQSLENSFSSSLDTCQQSTLPIAAIKIHDLGAKFVLKVRIYDIHFLKLNLKITPETVLIQGQPTEAMVVEGYFRPRGFESLILLPHPVQPETGKAQILPDGLTIELAKELKVQPSKVLIQLPTASLSDY
jgi:HSP20 family molecular chaperone IbpA